MSIYTNRGIKLEDFNNIKQNGNLDFSVEEMPVFDSNHKQIKGYKSLVRNDNGLILAIHNDTYSTTQHLTQMAEFDTLTNVFRPEKYVSAGSLNGGRKVFLGIKIPDVNREKDTFFYYGGSYDGSWADSYWNSLIMAVCENTLRLSIHRAQNIYKVKHTSNSKERLELWKEYFKELLAYINSFDIAMAELKKRQFTREKEEKFVKDLFGVKEKQIIPDGAIPWSEVSSKFKTPELEMIEISTRKQNQVNKVMELIETGKIEKESDRHSGYGMLMAVSNYATHHQSTRGTGESDREKEESRQDNKWLSTMFGSGNFLTQKTYDALLKQIN